MHAALEANRRRIDDLNVYPVPDGDTGTNLTLTVRAIDEALDGRPGRSCRPREGDLEGCVDGRARQLRRDPVADPARRRPSRSAVSDDLATAFRSASDAAYRAVKKPVEGTMLTAIRAMADAAETTAPTSRRSSPRRRRRVAQTREMLPVLKEAGVVDAGAAGLVEIVRGFTAALPGEALPERPPELEEGRASTRSTRSSRAFRYCTVFVVEGERLDADRSRSELEQFGDSLLVVGDARR